MIKAFTASPCKFDGFDFDKVGSGTGVARHGYGIYLGDAELAGHYQEQYQGYFGAERSYSLNGKSIEPGSTAFEVAEFLTLNRNDVDKAREHFGGSSQKLKVLDKLIDRNGNPVFDTEFGAILNVSIPNISEDDLKPWDGEVELDELHQMALTYLNTHVKISELNPQDFEAVGIDLKDFDSVEALIDELFDRGYEEGLEEGQISMWADESLYREAWDARVRQDNVVSLSGEQEFNKEFPKKYLELLGKIIANAPVFHYEMTYGDVYQSITHYLTPDAETLAKMSPGADPSVLGQRAASEFMANHLNIYGFIAPALYGGPESREMVIIDQKILKDAKIQKMDRKSGFELEF